MPYYMLILTTLILRKTFDVILDRPIDYAIDKIDEKFELSKNAHEIAQSTGIAFQKGFTSTGETLKNTTNNWKKVAFDSRKMYGYEVDSKGNIYKLTYLEYLERYNKKDPKYFGEWDKYKYILASDDTKHCITYKNSKYIIVKNNSSIKPNIKFLVFSFKLSEKYIREILELHKSFKTI